LKFDMQIESGLFYR